MLHEEIPSDEIELVLDKPGQNVRLYLDMIERYDGTRSETVIGAQM